MSFQRCPVCYRLHLQVRNQVPVQERPSNFHPVQVWKWTSLGGKWKVIGANLHLRLLLHFTNGVTCWDWPPLSVQHPNNIIAAVMRARNFLPMMATANANLEQQLTEAPPGAFDIENTDNCDGPLIEMVGYMFVKVPSTVFSHPVMLSDPSSHVKPFPYYETLKSGPSSHTLVYLPLARDHPSIQLVKLDTGCCHISGRLQQ